MAKKKNAVTRVKWIKIVTDIFDDEKILLIESLPESDSIIVIWFKLLCLAGKQNSSGVFLMENGLPYTEAMLAAIFRRKEATVAMAIQTFEQFGMIEIVNDAITIPKWGEHQNIEALERDREANRQRQQKYRAKQKLLTEGQKEPKIGAQNESNALVTRYVTRYSRVSNENVTPPEKIRLDKRRLDDDDMGNVVAVVDDFLDESNGGDSDYQKNQYGNRTPDKSPAAHIMDIYNQACSNLPPAEAQTQGRIAAAEELSAVYPLDEIQAGFSKANDNDFLRGKIKPNFRASYDWLIRPDNLARVLEGAYDNYADMHSQEQESDQPHKNGDINEHGQRWNAAEGAWML